MKLARRETLWPAVYGALMGALAGHFVSDIGLIARYTGVPAELAGAVAGALIAVSGGLRFLAAADVALFAIYSILALSPTMGFLAERWVRNDAPASADAVVVLSGGLASNGALAPGGLDRLLTGLAQVHEDRSRHLVTTRVVERIGGQWLVTDEDQRRTISLVDVSKWDIVGPVGTTRDEAVASAALLLPRAERHIMVVTSPMHTRRACAVFEKVGFTVTCVAAFEHDHPSWHPRTADERLASFRAYFYERAGMLKYRWRGWI